MRDCAVSGDAQSQGTGSGLPGGDGAIDGRRRQVVAAEVDGAPRLQLLLLKGHGLPVAADRMHWDGLGPAVEWVSQTSSVFPCLFDLPATSGLLGAGLQALLECLV